METNPFVVLNTRLNYIEALLHEMTKNQSPSIPSIQKDELLTKKEAARLLKVSVSTISNYARRGMLEKHHVGRVVRFRREDVMAIASPKK